MQNLSNKSGPEIKGLVLMGGQSSRMRIDKAFIDYHGKPQFLYLYDLLQELLGSAYLSCHPDRIPEGNFNVVTDVNTGMGPMSGVLAAFQKHSDHSWLVVACDYPYLNRTSLYYLLEIRDPARFATCFHNFTSHTPEPLIAIYEPALFPHIMKESKQTMSLRKVLANSNVHQIDAPDPRILLNANTPKEVAGIKKEMGIL